MGLKIELDGNTMLIRNEKTLTGKEVSSHNDHRIAMAAAVAALAAKGQTTITHAEAVNKSYPGFYEDLKKLNASVQTR